MADVRGCPTLNGARQALPDESSAIAAVLADAFIDYPWTRWTVDSADHHRRLHSLQELAIVELVVPFGEVWVVDDDAGHLVSAALWMLPGVEVDPSTQSRVASRSAELAGGRHHRAADAELYLAGLRPTTPHYFLGAVGTSPADQHHGHATDVLRPILERARAERVGVYLETSSTGNVGFYERLGFAVEHTVVIPDGGPHVWLMQRSPPDE